MKGGSALDYREVLRLLAINDEHFAEESGVGVESAELDPKTLALVRHQRTHGGRWRGSILRSRGRCRGECGCDGRRDRRGAARRRFCRRTPSVVAAAPSLAMALGYDINDALEQPSGV